MNHKELESWKKSMDLAVLIYEVSNHLPESEKYGLRSQIQRSSVSIPSNIAEGCGRSSDKELLRFLDISIGSACELETQLILTNRLFKKIGVKDELSQLTSVKQLLNGLKRYLNNKAPI